MRCLRGAAVVVLCILYFAIGRDLIAVARAKTGTTEMEVRSEVHQLTTDLKNVAEEAGMATVDRESLPALTSAAALAEAESLPD